MAKIASKNSQVLVGVGTNPTALTNARDWSIATTRNTIDVSTIGTEWKEFLTGQITATGSCNLLFDPDDTLGAAAVESAMWGGSPLSFYVRPEGSTAGKVEYTFTGLVTGWNISAATEDAIVVAVSFQATGAISKGTVSQ